MLFSYGYARQIINNRKKAAASLAISIAMRIRRYGAEGIAQWGRSMATLDATVIGHGIGGKDIPIMARLAKGQTLE